MPSSAPSVPPRPRSRQVRRQEERQQRRVAARQAVHPTPPPDGPPDGPPNWAPGGAAELPGGAGPLYESILTWLEPVLAAAGVPRPGRKRLALLVAGLSAGDLGTPSAVAATAFALGIGTATQEYSVARRVGRLLDDPHLNPQVVLPALATALLPTLLADVLVTHDHTIGTRAHHAGHHARWRGVRLVVDETTKEAETHVLVVGLAYRGLVVPLGVRTWPQNQTLPDGAYRTALASLLWEGHAALPPVLRAHVLVLADRGYGFPAMLDLLHSLGWSWVLRVQGQACVLLADGTTRPLRALAPRPGTTWRGPPTPATLVLPATPTGATDARDPTDTLEVTGVFKAAGWRRSRVVATWLDGAAAPWLLLTDLPATPARLLDYAARWSIERLFLSWKSHGWALEAAGVGPPPRLARLLAGYVLATWWRLAAALPVAQQHLDLLATRAGQAPRHPCQLPLPLDGALADTLADGVPSPPRTRPWAAKCSLFTYGHHVFRHTACATHTPRLCWTFPDWHAPTWSLHCRQVATGGTL